MIFKLFFFPQRLCSSKTSTSLKIDLLAYSIVQHAYCVSTMAYQAIWWIEVISEILSYHACVTSDILIIGFFSHKLNLVYISFKLNLFYTSFKLNLIYLYHKLNFTYFSLKINLVYFYYKLILVYFFHKQIFFYFYHKLILVYFFHKTKSCLLV